MCMPFSCLVTREARVYWKMGIDSHDELWTMFNGRDRDLHSLSEVESPNYVCVEIVPDDYVNPKSWTMTHDALRGEEDGTSWWETRHGDAANEAWKQWYRQVYDVFNSQEALHPTLPWHRMKSAVLSDDVMVMLAQWITKGSGLSVAGLRVRIDEVVGADLRIKAFERVWQKVGDRFRHLPNCGDCMNSIADAVAKVEATLTEWDMSLDEAYADWKSAHE